METMDAWETEARGLRRTVQVPGHGIDVTVYAPGDWSVFDALAKMAGEAMPAVQAKSPAVQTISEPGVIAARWAFTTPELMSAAEIATRLGLASVAHHRGRQQGFPV